MTRCFADRLANRRSASWGTYTIRRLHRKSLRGLELSHIGRINITLLPHLVPSCRQVALTSRDVRTNPYRRPNRELQHGDPRFLVFGLSLISPLRRSISDHLTLR